MSKWIIQLQKLILIRNRPEDPTRESYSFVQHIQVLKGYYYALTPWCRIFFEKLIVTQFVKQ